LKPDDFTHSVENFFRACANIFGPKNKDYTPDQAVLLDVFQTAYEEGIPPESVLRVHLQKHWTAIRRWTITRSLASEAIEDRLHDAANYIAILHLLSVVPVRDEIFAGIIRVKGSSCVCGCVAEATRSFQLGTRRNVLGEPPPPCEHGRFCRWLMTFASTLDSRPESWPMTRRALGSFLMVPNPTGATSPPAPSRSRTAMPRDIRLTLDTK